MRPTPAIPTRIELLGRLVLASSGRRCSDRLKSADDVSDVSLELPPIGELASLSTHTMDGVGSNPSLSPPIRRSQTSAPPEMPPTLRKAIE